MYRRLINANTGYIHIWSLVESDGALSKKCQMGYIQIWPLTESDGEQVALEDLVAKDRDPAPGSSSRSFKATLKGTCRSR
jgi:hypothetical protein